MGFAGVVRVFDVEVVAVGLKLLDGDATGLGRFDAVGEGTHVTERRYDVGFAFLLRLAFDEEQQVRLDSAMVTRPATLDTSDTGTSARRPGNGSAGNAHRRSDWIGLGDRTSEFYGARNAAWPPRLIAPEHLRLHAAILNDLIYVLECKRAVEECCYRIRRRPQCCMPGQTRGKGATSIKETRLSALCKSAEQSPSYRQAG